MAGRLEIEGVYTAYDKADVLEGISLKIEPGRITCLLGSNGSGKTTLIRSILGLTPPRAGHIAFDGQDITALPTHKVIAAGVACIPEGRKVFPKLTVEENLRLGAYQEPSEAVTQERMAEIFRLFPRLAERRISIFLVEQNVHQTLAISDYGYVLSKGRVVTEGKPSELAKTKEVHQAYFG